MNQPLDARAFFRSAGPIACLALVLASTPALAQTGTDAAAKPKPAAKPAPSPSRQEIKSKASNMAAGIAAAEAALTPDELAVAERVYTGKLPCELGAFVTLVADSKAPGYFNVTTGKLKFRMFPVATTTGAIRLEDQKQGAVWLQLANKSMLMSQKLGSRLADECMSQAQAAVAEALKTKPAVNPLEAPPSSPAATPTR
jgi:hypothetical protein